MPRSSIVSINHSSKRWVAISVLVQFKNRIPIEVNDLISIPHGEDRVDPSFFCHSLGCSLSGGCFTSERSVCECTRSNGPEYDRSDQRMAEETAVCG